LVGCLLLFGLAFILLAVISVSAQSESADRKVGALIVIVLFSALWAGFLTRLLTVGVFVSDDGMRIRLPLRTVTLRWSEVGGVYLAPVRLPRWLSWLWALLKVRSLLSTSRAIWIERIPGGPSQTFLNEKSAEFLGRTAAFDRAFQSLKLEVERRRGTA